MKAVLNCVHDMLDKTCKFYIFSGFIQGPLSLLRKCVENRLRVVVVIRAAVAVRSHCRGYVIAFDKHLNMVINALCSMLSLSNILL